MVNSKTRKKRAEERAKSLVEEEKPVIDGESPSIFVHGMTRGEMAQLEKLEVPAPKVTRDPGIWFIAWVNPGTELRTRLQLHFAGLETYVPLHRELAATRAGKKGKLKTILKPKFSQLVFVRTPQTDLTHAHMFLTNMVSRCIRMHGDTPSLNSFRTIASGFRSSGAKIVAISSSAFNRFYDVLEENVTAEPDAEPALFTPGDLARIIKGPFAGFDCLVDAIDDKKITALVDVFGRDTSVEFLHQHLTRSPI